MTNEGYAMSIARDIAPHLPYLRRFARAELAVRRIDRTRVPPEVQVDRVREDARVIPARLALHHDGEFEVLKIVVRSRGRIRVPPRQ